MEYMHTASEYVVAFVDILGASNKIKQDVNKSLNIVHQAYDESIDFLNTMYSGEVELLKPQIRIFSDNIVIAVPTSIKGRPSALISVMIYAGLIQHQFLHHQYLVCGGISMGEFFIDDVMVWGTALTRAYEIESSSLRRVCFESYCIDIGRAAFAGCIELQEIMFPGNMSDLTLGESAFEECSALKSLNLPDGYTVMLGDCCFAGCASLSTVVFGEGIEVIPGGAFYGCERLDKVIFSEGISAIIGDAFYNCKALKTIKLPESLERLSSRAFCGCDQLDKSFEDDWTFEADDNYSFDYMVRKI